MNKDQIKGRIEQAKGNVKETSGKIVGNDRLKNEGAAEQIKGKVQAGYGDAKQNAKDKAHNIIDKI
ncbi:MAG: CsbD family protein [Polaromonas sp.]